jgi:hypothetical protein
VKKDLYERLTAWLCFLVPEATVLRANQNQPAPKPPYLVFQITNANELDFTRGQNAVRAGDVHRLWVRRSYSLTLRCQLFAPTATTGQAEALADTFLNNLTNVEARQDHLKEGLSFMRILSGPDTVDGLRDSDFQSRVVLDLLMSASDDFFQEIDVIESVGVAGSLTGEINSAQSVTINISPF